MIRYKVVCIGLNDNLIFDSQYSGLETVNENQRMKHTYYKVGDELIEFMLVQSLDEATALILNKQSEKLLFIMNEITDAHVELLQLASKVEDVILAASISLSDDVQAKFEPMTNRFIQLKLISKVDIQTLMILVHYYLLVGNDIQKHNKLLVGCEPTSEPTGNIVMQILSSFQDFQNCQSFEISLLTKAQLNLEDLSYIEDPIYEYIPTGATLEVKNYTNQLMSNIIYFLMAGSE